MVGLLFLTATVAFIVADALNTGVPSARWRRADARDRRLPARRRLQFLAPAAAAAINPVVVVVVVTLGEVSMLGYLLIKGVRTVGSPPVDRPLVAP